jgi:hypothetical protein
LIVSFELIKERYSKITKLIIYFYPRESVEKTKYNQLKLYGYGMVIIDNKKHVLGYLKLIKIDRGEIDDDDDTYEIVITMSESKNKELSTNKSF